MLFRTFIGLKNEDERVILEKVASDIAAKDSSFTYTVRTSTLPQYAFLLIIYSDSYDKAQKRGFWMVTKPFGITKTDNKNLPLKYWVKPSKNELAKPVMRAIEK